MVAEGRQAVLHGIAPVASNSGRGGDKARYFRPATLPGVEGLHARFVDHRYASHFHDAWTVAWVIEGAATFDLGGARHVAPAESTFLIPAGAAHTGEPASPGGYQYRVLYIGPEVCRDTAGAALSPRASSPVVVNHAALTRSLSQLHASLGLSGRALEQSEWLGAVTAALVDLVGGERSAGRLKPNPKISAAIDYIHDHMLEDFSLSDLANAVETSPFHLDRAFHRAVGLPPSKYRRALRVLLAQRLLRQGRRPADVALECGFYDQSHFIRSSSRSLASRHDSMRVQRDQT